ncbi:phenylacetic acid degradation protein PaaD [compost metagenome]
MYLHDSEPVVGARVAAQHLNNQDIAHGGFLAALADSAYGIVMRRDMPGVVPRTAHLSVDYLSAVREGDWIEGRVNLVKHGRRIINATCCLTVNGRMVLQTMGVFATMSLGDAEAPAGKIRPSETQG